MHIVFTEIAGIALVFFSLTWLILAIITLISTSNRQRQLSIIPIILVLIGFGSYLGLTASTPFRRAYINLPMRELAASLIQNGLGFVLGVALALVLYVIAQRAQRMQSWRFMVISSIGLIVVFGGSLLWLYLTDLLP